MTPAPFVTGPDLTCICPALPKSRAEVLALSFCKALPLYNMQERDIFHEAIGTFAIESQQFLRRSENMNYSSVELIMKTFPSRFTTREFTQFYVHNPEHLANYVYAGRMGNSKHVADGDGYKYRGGGFCQITGKDMWQAYADYKKKPLDEILDLVRNTDEYALDSACWVFAVVKKLIPLAIDDQVKEIRKRINGGYNGLDSYITFVERAKKCMPIL